MFTLSSITPPHHHLHNTLYQTINLMNLSLMQLKGVPSRVHTIQIIHNEYSTNLQPVVHMFHYQLAGGGGALVSINDILCIPVSYVSYIMQYMFYTFLYMYNNASRTIMCYAFLLHNASRTIMCYAFLLHNASRTIMCYAFLLHKASRTIMCYAFLLHNASRTIMCYAFLLHNASSISISQYFRLDTII